MRNKELASASRSLITNHYHHSPMPHPLQFGIRHSSWLARPRLLLALELLLYALCVRNGEAARRCTSLRQRLREAFRPPR